MTNPAFKIALIGECWGEEEEREQKPFVGKAGQQLDKLLGAAGIARSECFITNVIHERPPKNDFGIYYTDKGRNKPTEALTQAHERLKKELKESGVSVVVPLGNEPLFALTGKRGIESWRGSILEGEGYKIIPTFHPSAVLRMGGPSVWYLPAAVKDLKRSLNETTTGLATPPNVRLILNSEELRMWLEGARGTTVALDIEVLYKYRGEEVASIAFSNTFNEAVVVPFVREVSEETLEEGKKKPTLVWTSVNTMPWEEMTACHALIKDFFASDAWPKVGQNLTFDINTLRRVGMIDHVEGVVMDTLVAHSYVHPEFPHALGFLATWYTRIPFFKDQIEEINEAFWRYNGLDACATLEVAAGLDKELKRMADGGAFYYNYLHKLLPTLWEMNHTGIRIDKDYQKDLKANLQKELAEEFDGIAGLSEGIIENHRSSVQCAKYFYEHKGYVPYTKKVKKEGEYVSRVTTDEIALKKIARKHQDPVASKLLVLREKQKQLSANANMKTDANGIVRTTYLFAKTGRFRSGADQE